MAKELNEDTSVKVSVKTLGGIAVLIFTLVGMWFTLQAEIQEAKELPNPLPPDVTRQLKRKLDKEINMDWRDIRYLQKDNYVRFNERTDNSDVNKVYQTDNYDENWFKRFNVTLPKNNICITTPFVSVNFLPHTKCQIEEDDFTKRIFNFQQLFTTLIYFSKRIYLITNHASFLSELFI